MNVAAVAFGLFYGTLTAGVFYLVSLLTSGLFSRPLYRLFTRILIGVCCVMLTAPGIRWLSETFPVVGVGGLWIAQYVAVGIMLVGVFKFNREMLPKIVARRAASVYFTFGAWANACIVTLAFLQIAFSGSPTWSLLGSDRAYLTAGHYGPLIMLLSAMIFHTDFRLKLTNRQPLSFSRFTFMGYAVAFFGLALSMLPYAGRALTELGISGRDWSLLQNASCAETLLIAIVLFAWLVWRYESIPPLFVLLMAIIFEYHVLVTQWVIGYFGPSSWGLASLPLFVTVGCLNYYFSTWDHRKQASRTRNLSAAALEATKSDENGLRFVIPFAVVDWGLGVALVGLTLWQRFLPEQSHAAAWTAVTFGVYAIYFYGRAFARRSSVFAYVAGGLALAAALLGVRVPGAPISALSVGVLGLLWAAFALVGERLNLKREWRTSFADSSLVAAVIALGLVASRHLISAQPYHFNLVGSLDAWALTAATFSFMLCAYQYRSSLPIYGGLLALATIAPTLSAGLSLLVVVILSTLRRRLPKDNALSFDERLKYLNWFPLPDARRMPELFIDALSKGAVPLAVAGFAISLAHIMRGNTSLLVLSGSAASSLTMGLLTRTHRAAWLYISAIAATYFTVLASAHAWMPDSWSQSQALSIYLLLTAIMAGIAWTLARANARWCQLLLERVAEERETEISERGYFYSGLLQRATVVLGMLSLAGLLWALVFDWTPSFFLLLSAGVLCVFFIQVATTYRTQFAAYLSFLAVAIGVVCMVRLLALPWCSPTLAVAMLGLVAAAFSASFEAFSREPGEVPENRSLFDRQPLPMLEFLPAAGWQLWVRPSAVFAVLCIMFSLFSLQPWNFGDFQALATTTDGSLRLSLGSAALLLSTRAFRVRLTYLLGLLLGFAAMHSWFQFSFLNSVVWNGDVSAHLALAAGLCLTASLVAVAWANQFNRRLAGSDEERVDTVLNSREFYAGLLEHFTLAYALPVAIALVFVSWQVWNGELENSGLWTVASLLLAVTFAFSGAVYRSRIQSYLALLAVVVTCYLANSLWVADSMQMMVQEGLLPGLAILFGTLAWLIGKPASSELEHCWDAEWPWPQCWRRPPLPFVSVSRSLWSQPLAKASIVLALLSIARSITDLSNLETVWDTVPLVIAALALFIATFTFRLGVFSWFSAKRSQNGSTEDQLERGLLLTASLATCGGAMHFALQKQFFLGTSPGVAAGWHLLIAAAMGLILWLIASIVAAYFRRQMEGNAASGSSRSQVQADATLYVVLPLQLAGLLGILVPVIAIYGSLLLFPSSLPLVVAVLISALVLGLLSGSFQAHLGSYLSLAAVGVAFLLLSKYLFSDAWPLYMWGPVALTTNSLILMSLASVLTTNDGKGEQSPVPMLPHAWSFPGAMRSTRWAVIWGTPIRDVALICLSLALIFSLSNLVLVSDLSRYAAPLIANCLLAAASLLLAVKVYRSAWPMYLSVCLLAIGTFPLFALLERPIAETGQAWALLALTMWLVSFAIERRVRRRLGRVDSSTMPIRLYERPIFRCAAVLAGLSVLGTLISYVISSIPMSAASLVVTCGLGAVTLMLCARSANVIHRETLARFMVYLACAAIAGCVLALTWSITGPNETALAAVTTAFLMSVIGFGLMHIFNHRANKDACKRSWFGVFGEPLSYSGLWLSVATMVLALVQIAIIWLDRVPFSGLGSWQHVHHGLASISLLLVAVNCLIGVRSVRQAAWLHAAVVAGGLGTVLLMASQLDLSQWSVTLLIIAASLCSVAFASYLQRNGKKSEFLIGLPGEQAEFAFFLWPALAVTCLFPWQGMQFGWLVWQGTSPAIAWPWILCSLFTIGFYYQSLYREPRVWWLSLMFFATAVTVSFVGILYGGRLIPVDIWIGTLGLAWGSFAFRLQARFDHNQPIKMPGIPAFQVSASLAKTATNLAFAALTLAFLISLPVALSLQVPWPSMALTCLIVATGFAISSWRSENLTVATAAMVLLPLGLGYGLYYFMQAHFYMPLETMPLFAGCMLILVGFVYSYSAGSLLHIASDSKLFATRCSKRLQFVAAALVVLASASAVYAAIELEWFLLPASMLGLASTWWLVQAFASTSERYVYFSLATLGVALAMVVHGYLGIPLFANSTLAFGVIASSFLFFGVNVLSSRTSPDSSFQLLVRPSYHVAIFGPCLLLATIPFGEHHLAAFCLLAAAAFYFIVAHTNQHTWAVYVAILCTNAAVYLWIPELHKSTGLIQLYVIPAAFSVLIFAQLHRREMSHQVLSSIRYAAAGTILATSSFEVFVDDGSSLVRFIMVLTLSLAGTAAGIALRVRPFVFVGLAFLTLNVVAQLGLQFQREGGIIRAAILIGVGILVLAAMIFFNIHRERILRQYRRFMADAQWE